ncbi:MAG: hypothetical protein JNK78_12440 [Planctomycetes bacterium]|nr:hypothetical protein [Planctomycetota bacterium]
MTVLVPVQQIDEVARRNPGGGAGYHEQQTRDLYDPAIEHPRQVFHELLCQAVAAGPVRTVLEIGVGRHGARHHALRLVAERVVSVDSAARLRRLEEGRVMDRERSVCIVGEGHEPEVRAEVERAASGCDVLLIDAGDRYARTAAAWRGFAGLVRPGGLVAIVDRCQAWPRAARHDGVDRFAYDLATRWLGPRGRVLERLGSDHAIHCYRRVADDDEGAAFWPMPAAEPGPVPVGGAPAGFCWFVDGERWIAARGDFDVFDAVDVERGGASLAFVADSEAALRSATDRWLRAERLAHDVLRALARRDEPGFRRSCDEAAAGLAAEGAWWVDALQRTPHSTPLLRVAGALECVLGRHDVAAALLRAAVDLDFADSGGIAALVAVEQWLRGDDAAAKELLSTLKRRVAARERTRVCLAELSGHVLWTQPRLLHERSAITWVGPGGGDAMAAARRLGMQITWIPNGHAVPAAAAPGARIVPRVIGGAPGRSSLWLDPEDGSLAVQRWAPAFERERRTTQREIGPVATTTLDVLLEEGGLVPADLDVLVLDVPGAAAAVLRGAERSLAHVRTLCLAVRHQSVFPDSLPHPEVLQRVTETGLHFAGCEPGLRASEAFAFFQRPVP